MMDLDKLEGRLPGVSKSKKKQKPTLRFELDLPESTDTSCPEYSYVELVRQFLKEKKSKGENDSLCQDLLEEEEEKEKNEAEALAQYYEIKYGAGAASTKGKKRKDRLKDLVDVGYGYDETDPFVDDSEVYDEIVPASLTTQHGGFYINTGKLEFRAVSDDSDEDSVPLSQHISKKKKLKTMSINSDESENEFKNGDTTEKKKRKKKLKDHERKKKRKLSINGKDKLSNLSKSSKKMKKSSASYAQKLVAKAKAQQMMNASSVGSPAHSTNGGLTPSHKNSTEDQMKSRLVDSGRDLGNIHDKDLAQVAKNVTKEIMNVGGHWPDNDTALNIEVMDIGRPNSSSPEYLELPPNLPQNLEDKIKSLKQIAKMAEGEGKQKFFSSDVNRILLEIEEESQNLRTKVRQGMYQNIAYHLPCSKDTLMKRAKKLYVNDWDKQVKGPLEKLSKAVDAVMTYQIEEYLQECAMQPIKGKTAASTDEDDECEEKSGLGASECLENGGEKTKRTYAPRRKFKWDEKLRNLLCQVVTVKMNQYEKCKVREKITAEEYLKAFLDSEVKPLWPKPWMQTRILFKESRAAHSHLTLSSNCSKQKKDDSGSSPEVAKEIPENLLDKRKNVQQSYVKRQTNVVVGKANANSKIKKVSDSRQREKKQGEKSSEVNGERKTISSNAKPKHKKHISRRKLLKIRHAARREWNFVSHYTKGPGDRHTVKQGTTSTPLQAMPVVNNSHKHHHKSATNGSLSQIHKKMKNSDLRNSMERRDNHKTAEGTVILTKQKVTKKDEVGGKKHKVNSWIPKPSSEAQIVYRKKYEKSEQVGSGKKGGGVASMKQEKKTIDVVHPYKASVSSSCQNLMSGSTKSTKKQLFQEESSAKQTTALPQGSALPKKDDKISKILDIASGSFELIASIEGENSPLASPVLSNNKEKISKVPKSSVAQNWKHGVNSVGTSKSTSSSQNFSSTHPTTKVSSSSSSKSKTIPATHPTGTSFSSGKRDKLSQPNPNLTSSPYKIDTSMEDPYLASEWIKMATSLMMGTPQMSMKSSVGYPSTGTPAFQPGMPNLNNMNVIQNILGLKPEDMVGHKLPSQRDSTHSPRANSANSPDNKFQFKIVPPALPLKPQKQDKPIKSIDIVVNPEDLTNATKALHKAKEVPWSSREMSQDPGKTVDLSKFSKTYSPSKNTNPGTSKLKQYSTAAPTSNSALKKDQFISFPRGEHVKQFAPKNITLSSHNYPAKVSKGNMPKQSQTAVHTVLPHSYQKIPSHTSQHSRMVQQSNNTPSMKLTHGVTEPHILPSLPSPHKLSQVKQGNVYSLGQNQLNKPQTCYAQTITSPISASSGFVLAHQGHMNFPSSLLSSHAYSSSSSNFFPANRVLNSGSSHAYKAATLNSMQNKASSSLMSSQGKTNDMHDGKKGLFKPPNIMNHRFEGNHNR